jgi:hypothetical protein
VKVWECLLKGRGTPYCGSHLLARRGQASAAAFGLAFAGAGSSLDCMLVLDAAADVLPEEHEFAVPHLLPSVITERLESF